MSNSQEKPQKTIELSIVVPVYYNEETLYPLYFDLKEKVLDRVDFECELILVDDGSRDKSWAAISELSARDSRVRGYRLSRNFGSHAAILCGLNMSRGRCAVVKAADLQEPSELVLEMHSMWERGNKVVLAVRQGRSDGSAFTKLYYRMTRDLALPSMPLSGFDVYLLDADVIEVLNRMNERNSALTGQILWSGFKTAYVYYERLERTAGKSRWTLRKKIRLVADTLFSFTSLPISFVTGIGTLACAISLIWAVVVLVNKLVGNIPVAGFTSLLIFQLFSFGIVMVTLGILGGYLWRTFDASRDRPVYIIEDAAKGAESALEAESATHTAPTLETAPDALSGDIVNFAEEVQPQAEESGELSAEAQEAAHEAEAPCTGAQELYAEPAEQSVTEALESEDENGEQEAAAESEAPSESAKEPSDEYSEQSVAETLESEHEESASETAELNEGLPSFASISESFSEKDDEELSEAPEGELGDELKGLSLGDEAMFTFEEERAAEDYSQESPPEDRQPTDSIFGRVMKGFFGKLKPDNEPFEDEAEAAEPDESLESGEIRLNSYEFDSRDTERESEPSPTYETEEEEPLEAPADSPVELPALQELQETEDAAPNEEESESLDGNAEAKQSSRERHMQGERRQERPKKRDKEHMRELLHSTPPGKLVITAKIKEKK